VVWGGMGWDGMGWAATGRRGKVAGVDRLMQLSMIKLV
jgi:hypothetical protein